MVNGHSSQLVDISTALSSLGNISVIGVVVDVFGGVFQSNRSRCITFTVKDSGLDNGHTWDGLKVKYFKDNESLMPPVRVHDVILLRNISVRRFNGKTFAVAADGITVPWAIFRQDSDQASSVSPISGPVPFVPSYSETTHALSLLERSSEIRTFRNAPSLRPSLQNSYSLQASYSKPKSYTSRKFSLIKDIVERTFVDLIGEVVKIYHNESEKATLYITDYTTNKDLYDYTSDGDNGREGDQYNYLPTPKKQWTGPSGQMTLQITLWEPHATFARGDLSENDIVYLTNVHIKRSRGIENGNLEASIHSNRHGPNTVNIRIVDPEMDDRAQELLRRKKEYRAKNPSKRKYQEDHETSATSNKINPKKNKRQNNELKKEQNQTSLELARVCKPNESVQASHPGVKCLTLEDILANESHNNVSPDNIHYRLPFQNLCYRATVRVVDFFPPKIEDFSVPKDRDSDGFIRWEWRFCLLVESVPPPPQGQSKEQMKLFVSDKDAQCLLKMDATDLRQLPKVLRQLSEKISHLWGDLEKQKNEVASMCSETPRNPRPITSKPFTCCIKEYGVRCSHASSLDTVINDDDYGCSHQDCFGWERRFAMFMTTIHD